MYRQFILFVFFCVLMCGHAYAQDTPVKADSAKVYKQIENYSKRSKFTQFIYGIFFVPVSTKSPPKKKTYKRPVQKPYSAFEGKIIRHINIETLDPFGNSIADTITAKQNFIIKAGNKMHIKSYRSTILNLLLIRQNQVFDSLLVKESERLIRSQTYVNDVAFYVTKVSANSDSVDITIRELDKWSIVPGISYTEARFTFQVLEKNFLGSGHAFTNAYTWNTRGRNGFNTDYFVPNIRSTYMNATVHYGKDEFRIFTKSIAVDRPFFSPYAKWAGGINFTQQYRRDTVPPKDSLIVLKHFKFNAQDYWAGSAVQIVKGNTENQRNTNFISSIRFYRVRYTERPSDAIDTLRIFADQNFYLTSVGISTRKYVADKFVFNYGITENVPIGRVHSITAGYQQRNNAGRVYLGTRFALGNYYSWGYLSTNLEYGTFFRRSRAEQGVLSVGIIYFTGLLEIGKWKFRQFVKPQVIVGLNRYSYDSLTVNEGYGIDGFKTNALSGTSKILFSLQSQSYAPWNFIGFRFGPYLTYTLGMLGDPETGFKRKQVFSQFGLGVLIKNLNLVFSTFQISLAYYPTIPGRGDNIFKFNPYKTTDFIIRDFEIGKPATVAFQ